MSNGISELIKYIESYNSGESKIVYKENEALSAHSTFKIGGSADLFVCPYNADALIFLLKKVKDLGLRYFILGHGSNLLFDDDGFNGVIISTESMNKLCIENNIITAESGVLLTHCAVCAKEASLSGMECLYGIPGTVGGAVYMNAGAYGSEMKDIVTESVYLDPVTLQTYTIVGEEHGFGYRESVFRENGGIILSTKMVLKDGEKSVISDKMAECKRLRLEKQPLEFPSAGSTFKRYPGRYTAQMIDEAGLKGYTVGGAQVSKKHAGFVINIGNATSKDVCQLIDHIKSEINKLYGIDIETEVITVK